MKFLVLSLLFAIICSANDKFIRKVMDYERGGGELQIRYKCVRNPPLNRCSDSDFISMASESCPSSKYTVSVKRKIGCIKDPKQNYLEVCNLADITCMPKSSTSNSSSPKQTSKDLSETNQAEDGLLEEEDDYDIETDDTEDYETDSTDNNGIIKPQSYDGYIKPQNTRQANPRSNNSNSSNNSEEEVESEKDDEQAQVDEVEVADEEGISTDAERVETNEELVETEEQVQDLEVDKLEALDAKPGEIKEDQQISEEKKEELQEALEDSSKVEELEEAIEKRDSNLNQKKPEDETSGLIINSN
tara:strand:- start:144746 stop:145654 length:909 start_codon:yes stop_codon:yes gene_type:complete